MTELDKQSLSERDIGSKFIMPAVKRAGDGVSCLKFVSMCISPRENHCPRRTSYAWEG